MEWLTTYQIGANKHTLKSDHDQPCLNILCAKYNKKHKLYYFGKFYLTRYW